MKGIEEHTAASGNGPVNALDHALRKALEDFYPNLREMSAARLQGAHPRRVQGHRGARRACSSRRATATRRGARSGVADNIIEASWQALVDSVEYKLRRDEKKGTR